MVRQSIPVSTTGCPRSQQGLVQFAVYVLVIVFSIVAAVRVNNGGSYRYPISLRLIK